MRRPYARTKKSFAGSLSHPFVMLAMGGTSDDQEPPMSDPISISCDDCTMQGTDACNDCIVTFICSREPGDAIIIDAAEERAVRLLIKNGLVPDLRHTSSAG
jgi:hypothetical protein